VDGRFWERKQLEQMSVEEWESLCDGCGRCCLYKLEDEDSGEIAYTRVACRLLDGHACRCTRYAQRQQHVPDCLTLTPADARSFRWLPATCAYRLLAEGKPLQWWHPLISGDPDSIHRAGISVRGSTVSENDVSLDDLEDHVVDD
jgi:uncharacterized protein